MTLLAKSNSDAKKRGDQVCEVRGAFLRFYVGQYHLLNGRGDEARTMLRTAEKECAKSLLEYEVRRRGSGAQALVSVSRALGKRAAAGQRLS